MPGLWQSGSPQEHLPVATIQCSGMIAEAQPDVALHLGVQLGAPVFLVLGQLPGADVALPVVGIVEAVVRLAGSAVLAVVTGVSDVVAGHWVAAG